MDGWIRDYPFRKARWSRASRRDAGIDPEPWNTRASRLASASFRRISSLAAPGPRAAEGQAADELDEWPEAPKDDLGPARSSRLIVHPAAEGECTRALRGLLHSRAAYWTLRTPSPRDPLVRIDCGISFRAPYLCTRRRSARSSLPAGGAFELELGDDGVTLTRLPAAPSGAVPCNPRAGHEHLARQRIKRIALI